MYKLLIVDDEMVIRTGLSSLPWKDNEIELAAVLKNGIEAEEWLNDNEPDIILTDIKMPGMNGIELAKLALNSYPMVKIILLSGYGEFEYAREAIRHGVFDYILKPSTPDEIMECVKRASDRKKDEIGQQEKIQKLEAAVSDITMLPKPNDENIIPVIDDEIDRIIQYIYSNFDKKLTLTVLSEEFHLTSVYLSHFIKKETGYTFLEILNTVRMYYAAKYLKETKMKNGEICERIGVSDERYFGQLFKKRYGMTPYEYRKIGDSVNNPFERFLEKADNR